MPNSVIESLGSRTPKPAEQLGPPKTGNSRGLRVYIKKVVSHCYWAGAGPKPWNVQKLFAIHVSFWFLNRRHRNLPREFMRGTATWVHTSVPSRGRGGAEDEARACLAGAMPASSGESGI